MGHHVLIHEPRETGGHAHHLTRGVLVSDLLAALEQALQRVQNHRLRERIDHDAAVGLRRTFGRQESTGLQVGEQRVRRDTRRADEVGGVVLRHQQAVTVDTVRNRGNRRRENALPEVLQLGRQFVRGERNVNVELRVQRQRDARLGLRFSRERGTGHANIAGRTADVDGRADLRAAELERIVVVAVDLTGEGQVVDQEAHGFTRHLGRGQKAVGHF